MDRSSAYGLLKALLLVAALLSFGCSTFHLASTPVADVYEGGEKIGQTPYSFNLVSGERVLTLKRFGYVEEEVRVTSLDPRDLHFNLQWVGTTRINSNPPGAEIVRIGDGKLLGKTPVGLHLSRPDRVVLKLNGFESVERDIDPNGTYNIELKSKTGFKSTFYKDIMFTSEQGSIEIFDRVAGERIGITPVRLNVEAGAALEYRFPGCKSEFALISRNAPHRIEIRLEPLTRVTIDGPEGAAVYQVGGAEKIGEVPFEVNVDGYAMFEVKKEGYYDRSVAVSPESPARVRIDLEKIPYKTIVTDPPGAAVYRLGGLEKLGDSPYTAVIEGERVFEIKKQGFRPSVIGLGPSSPEQTNVPLSPAPRDDPDAAAIGTLDSRVIESF